MFPLRVLSKVENPGSPKGPSTVDRWVVGVTFGWSVYVVRNDHYETTISQCDIYISNSPILWKFDRWLSSNVANPHLSFFHDWSPWLEYFKTQPHSFESSSHMRDHEIRCLKKNLYNLVNRGPVSMSQTFNCICKKYFGNTLVAKRTTLRAIMGRPLRLWVAFGDRATISNGSHLATVRPLM